MRFRMLLLPALLIVLTREVAAQDTYTGVDRIVAVGDVHGDFVQFLTVLRQAAVIDANAPRSRNNAPASSAARREARRIHR